MTDHPSVHIQDQTAQQALTACILQPLMEKRRPQRVLILNHHLAADIMLQASASAEIITLSDQANHAGAQLFARLDALPFAEVTFDLVVIQHLVSDGTEDVLAEAIRVLAPGGDIVISGLNCAGLRYHNNRRGNRYPGLKINRTIFHLNANLFTIRRCLRSGFLGMSRPLAHSGWSGLSIPFTDRIVIQARHRSGGQTLRLAGFDRAQSASLSSANLSGIRNRKSMQ